MVIFVLSQFGRLAFINNREGPHLNHSSEILEKWKLYVVYFEFFSFFVYQSKS